MRLWLPQWVRTGAASSRGGGPGPLRPLAVAILLRKPCSLSAEASWADRYGSSHCVTPPEKNLPAAIGRSYSTAAVSRPAVAFPAPHSTQRRGYYIRCGPPCQATKSCGLPLSDRQIARFTAHLTLSKYKIRLPFSLRLWYNKEVILCAAPQRAAPSFPPTKGAFSLNSVADVWQVVLRTPARRRFWPKRPSPPGFDEVEAVAIRDMTFYLCCPNDFKRGTIESLFLPNLKAALKEIFSADFDVKLLSAAEARRPRAGEAKKPTSLWSPAGTLRYLRRGRRQQMRLHLPVA